MEEEKRQGEKHKKKAMVEEKKKKKKRKSVSLVKWIKNNYEDETLQEMITKGVPGKKIRSSAPSRY